MIQMANGLMSDVLRYVVPRAIIGESVRKLRSLSGGYRESVILWTGTHRAEEAMVRRIVVPRQRASALHFDVPLRERLRLARELAGCGEKLLVQLHTHPAEAFHSDTDDRLALPRHTGAISIVVPDFAAEWEGDLSQLSVNRHLGEGVWEELSQEAVTMLIEVC